MSAARHFTQPGTLTAEQLKTDIQDDVTSARGAQQQLQQTGQYGGAARMGDAVDEYLDELADASNGTWTPKHA